MTFLFYNVFLKFLLNCGNINKVILMKIVVTSDCHGNVETLKTIAKLHHDADLFIDAGDSCLRKEELYPFETVRGNCDFYIKNKYRIDSIADISIYTVHGNGLFFNDNYLAKTARDFGCKIAIHGHTHIPKILEVDGVLIVCPGSVSFPRSKEGKTFVVITINNNKEISAKIEKIN